MQDEASSSPLRVAIIGYGLAGMVFHAPLVQSTPGMVVAGIVTSNLERRARAQRDHPQAVILDSADEIWRIPGRFDLVVVASANTAHAPLATAAMEAGIPVVVDKPLALSSQEAEALVATSERTGVALTCFQNRRWDGDFLTLHQIISDGTLGPITRLESRFERYRPVVRPTAWRERTPLAEGGGLLWDLGSHLIDQARLLFGPPVQVYAELPYRRAGAIVDDDTFVALTFESGITAHLWMSVTTRLPGPRFRLSGLGGAYEKYGLDPQEDALRRGMRPGDEGWGQEPRAGWGRVVTNVGGVSIDGTVETLPGAYESFYAGVRDALLENAPMPVDVRDSVEVVRVIEEAIASAR